jgi:hypothetical protein
MTQSLVRVYGLFLASSRSLGYEGRSIRTTSFFGLPRFLPVCFRPCFIAIFCLSAMVVLRRRMGAYSVREKQGFVPGLQLDDSHYELKGIRVDSSRTN